MKVTATENVIINKEVSKKMLVVLKKFPFAYSLFFYLINNMDSNNSFACSKKALEVELEHNAEYVEKALDLLTKVNFVEVKNSESNTEESIFVVNPDIATLKQ